MVAQPQVWIVDDELSMRVMLERMLASESYKLSLLNNGKALLEKLEHDTPDLILLDVMLPDSDGFELCRRLKIAPAWQHIPIILVTSLDGKELLQQGAEAGADDFLHKPVIGLEVRARVRSMLRLKQQYDALQEVMKMREELSNMVIHDMSSPIIAVLLNTSLLEEKVDDDELRGHLQQIHAAADRLDSFVNDMLMFAKLEQSKLHINPVPTNINDLILDAQTHFTIIAQSKNIDLVMDLPDKPIEALVDSTLFQRVIANLLSNSIQYSENNTVVKIVLEPTERKGKSFKIKVIDQGPGIPAAYKDKIFQKFEVVNMKRKGVSQIGLGLTFCKLAVDAHEGRIYVTDNQPQGAIFVVEI